MIVLPRIKPLLRALVPGALGFFLGRVVVFQFVSPLAIAYSACGLGLGGVGFYLTAALTLAGVWGALHEMYIFRYIAAFCLLGIANAAYAPRLRKVPARAGAAAAATLAAGLAFAALRDMSAYFAVAATVEAAFVFGAAIVLERAASLVTHARRTRMLGIEEQISFAILAAAVAVGAVDIRLAGVSLGWIFLCALLPMIVYKLGGAYGGSAGLLLGTVLSVAGRADEGTPVVLGIAAIVAGLFRGGKVKTSVGFIAGLAASALFVGRMPPVSVFVAALIGATIFALAPLAFYLNMDTHYTGSEYLSRVKMVLSQRLYGFSHSFGKLSRTFSALAATQPAPGADDLARLVDEVSENACRKCGRRTFCWERSYYDTHRMILQVLNVCKEKNRIEVNDIPAGFRAACVSAPWLAETINRLYELHRVNRYWRNRIAESRGLISEQLGGVAKLIQSLASELDVFMNFKADLETSLSEELAKSGIEVTQVIVLENRLGKYEVSIRPRRCPGRAECVKGLSRAAGRVLGRRMHAEDDQCTYNRGCSMRLIEEQRFRIVSGVACRSKTGSPVSGDSYSFMELRGGQCMLALSDGMGSGEKAREESAAAVELLEDFIESGFEKDMAVKLINSVLVLRSEEDSFSTLDICSIDLYTGQAEFIKIGAAATYLLRDGAVQIIKSSSLPIGILDTVDIEISSRMLQENDVIIMVTDGITEAADSYGETAEPGAWITGALGGRKWRDPQDIANRLMADAEKRAGGVFRDDMTVLAARVWQRG